MSLKYVDDHIFLSEMYSTFADDIKKDGLDTKSPTDVIARGARMLESKQGMSLEEKKSCLMKLIEEVAKGKDGVLGTDDDLLPKDTVEALRILIDGGLLGDIVKFILAATEGRFDGATAVKASTKVTKIVCLCCQRNAVKHS